MQTTLPVPFDIFSSELSPGETVQWSGQPNARVIFHSEDWGFVPFSLLWGGFAIFWLLSASGIWDIWNNHPNKNFGWFGVVWGTPFVLVGQYMIWGRFVHDYWKKHRTYYALTTKRALIVVDGLRGRTASSAYFESTGIIEKSVRRDGIGRISFGGPVTASGDGVETIHHGHLLLMTSTVPTRCIKLRPVFENRYRSREPTAFHDLPQLPIRRYIRVSGT
jgi:hypothetical protein